MFIWLPFREQPRQIRELFGHNLIVTLAPDRFVDSDTNEGQRLWIVCQEGRSEAVSTPPSLNLAAIPESLGSGVPDETYEIIEAETVGTIEGDP